MGCGAGNTKAKEPEMNKPLVTFILGYGQWVMVIEDRVVEKEHNANFSPKNSHDSSIYQLERYCAKNKPQGPRSPN